MAFMRSTVAYWLFWVNLISTSLILYFANSPNKHSHNLRGTSEKLLGINHYYVLDINHNYDLEEDMGIQKNLRNLG